MADLEYRNIHVVFDVRKKGTEKWNGKSLMCGVEQSGNADGKPSENYRIAPIEKATGILSSTKGLYLPKATTPNGK